MRSFLICVTLISTGLLSACAKKTELSYTEGFAQGTTYHITYDNKSAQEQALIAREINAEFERLDKAISNYRDDSLIEQFNAQQTTEPLVVSAEIIRLIEIARSVSTVSHGCYDLTIKPLFDLWGFKKDQFHMPTDDELQKARALVGMDKLQTLDATHLRKTLPNLRVDLSSIGQGYSVSRMVDILKAHHVENYLVEIGGELQVRGKKPDGKPWRIAMEKPISTERKVEKIAVFENGDPMSLMPSGTYHHFFDNNGKRYSHILDARTGKPVEHNTALANAFMADSTYADAWSTALLCMGSREGMQVANEQGIAALFVDQQGDELVEQQSAALKKLSSVKLEAPSTYE